MTAPRRALLGPSGGVTLALGHGFLVVDRTDGSAIVASPAAYGVPVLVVTRHRLPLAGYADRAAALDGARDALGVLAERPGFVRGWITQAVDEPDLLLVAHEWEDVGSYRRALSSYDVKLRWPFLQTAVDEATAFEVLVTRTPTDVVEASSARAADADTVGLGGRATTFDRSGDM